MIGTKEFYDLLEQFEKDLPKMPFYVSAKVERCTTEEMKKHKSTFYHNGEINKIFISYMFGCSFGKCVERNA